MHLPFHELLVSLGFPASLLSPSVSLFFFFHKKEMQWTREKDGVVQEAKGRWFSYKLSSNVKESREGKTEVLVGICSESEIPRDRKIAGIRNTPDVVLACGRQGDWMQRMNIIKEQWRAHSQSCPISICNQPQDPGQIEFCKVCLLINKLQITYTINIVIDRELHACCLVYEKGPSNHLHHYKKIAHNAREISNGGWARNKLQTGIIFFRNFFFCFMTFHIELFCVPEGASLSEILFWILPALLSWRNCVQFNIKIW